MIDLIAKCDNPIYHQTIKFYFHRLTSDEKKLLFIRDVAKVNILLASQCIMSDKKNEIIDTEIKELAISDAQNFKDSIKSSYGLLALAEFELYDIILYIFNSIEKLNKFHFSVLNKVFNQAESDTYLKFIETFTNSEKLGSLLATFISFKGEISINNQSKEILHKFIIKLIKQDYCSFLIMYFNKYSLWDKVEIIFGTKITDIISELLKGQVGSVRLAFYLVKNLNLKTIYTPATFIDILSKFVNKKALGVAIRIAVANSVTNIKLTNSIIKLLVSTNKTSKKVRIKNINYLKNKGLMIYAESIPEIKNLTINFIDNPTIKLFEVSDLNEYDINLHSDSDKYIIQEIFGDENYLSIQNKYSLNEFWIKVFDYYKLNQSNLYLDNVIIQAKSLYNTNYQNVCASLSLFKHEGVISTKKEFGYYIQPNTFKSTYLCFMHLSLNGDSSDIQSKQIIVENQIIEFKIVGFKEINKRINVYLY